MSLQLEWQYLQKIIPGVDAPMDLLELNPRKDFLPVLFVVEEVYNTPRKLLFHGVKRGGSAS